MNKAREYDTLVAALKRRRNGAALSVVARSANALEVLALVDGPEAQRVLADSLKLVLMQRQDELIAAAVEILRKSAIAEAQAAMAEAEAALAKLDLEGASP